MCWEIDVRVNVKMADVLECVNGEGIDKTVGFNFRCDFRNCWFVCFRKDQEVAKTEHFLGNNVQPTFLAPISYSQHTKSARWCGMTMTSKIWDFHNLAFFSAFVLLSCFGVSQKMLVDSFSRS